MNLRPEDVEEILALLDGLPVDDLELETPDFRLTLRRDDADGGWAQEVESRRRPRLDQGSGGGDGPTAAAGADGRAAGGDERVADRDARAVTGDGPPASGETAAGQPVPDGLAAVRAPLVGTFYRAPRPGAAPFVEVGDEVGEDTIVGIVETMKLMNSVEAGVRGQVTEILPADAELVQQGQPLVLVRPAS